MGFRLNLKSILKPSLGRFFSTTHKNSQRIFSVQSLDLYLHHSNLGIGISNNTFYKIPKRWHLGHTDHHDHQQHHHHYGKEGEHVIRLGLIADIGLAAGKALTGYLSGSTAIIADAAHSVSDMVLSGVALWSYKAANVPKDEDHPYGHGKFETLGALGISCMLLATSGGIAWHASEILMGLFSAAPEINQSMIQEHVHNHNPNHGGHHHGIDMDHPVLALNMTIISICVKEGLYWMTKRAGEKENSGLMKANAWHHRTDAISSAVALVGVGGSILGVKFLDPLAGLAVSGMILKVGLESAHQSIMELVDAAIPIDQLDPIRKTILQVEGVKGCHRLRGRRAGPFLYLDVHIEVHPYLSISVAHEIGRKVSRQIQESHPDIAEVFIHLDPWVSQFPPSVTEQEGSFPESAEHHKRENILPEGEDIDTLVSNIIVSKFPEKVEVERISNHLLNGKFILDIEVSMPSNILIRDAMEVAKEAEWEILNANSNIFRANILLRLGINQGH